MTAPVIRRVRSDEWERIRDLRLDALRDEAAAIAFLHSFEEEAARPDGFWQDRAVQSAVGNSAAQFIAEIDSEWVGTISVLRWATGATDHHGRHVSDPRGDVVGVYVRPVQRGAGVIDALLSAAAAWARNLGDALLTLDVHADNARAQAAYRRTGFVPNGRRFTGAIGEEIEMTLALKPDKVLS